MIEINKYLLTVVILFMASWLFLGLFFGGLKYYFEKKRKR